MLLAGFSPSGTLTLRKPVLLFAFCPGLRRRELHRPNVKNRLHNYSHIHRRNRINRNWTQQNIDFLVLPFLSIPCGSKVCKLLHIIHPPLCPPLCNLPGINNRHRIPRKAFTCRRNFPENTASARLRQLTRPKPAKVPGARQKAVTTVQLVGSLPRFNANANEVYCQFPRLIVLHRPVNVAAVSRLL